MQQAYRKHCVGGTVEFETYIKIRHDFAVPSAGTSAWPATVVPSIASVQAVSVWLLSHFITQALDRVRALLVSCSGYALPRMEKERKE